MSQAVIEEARSMLEANCKSSSAALNSFPNDGPMGLTPDHVKASPEFQGARKAYSAALSALQAFNTKYRPVRRARS